MIGPGVKLDMRLDLTDEEEAALLRELNNIIENDRYPLSARRRAARYADCAGGVGPLRAGDGPDRKSG